jgi:hypothetical protein
LVGVRGFVGAALVRFIAGDAEPLARADDALRAPEADDLRAFAAVDLRAPAADLLLGVDDFVALRPADDLFALPALDPDVFFLAPVFAARFAVPLASIAFRSGDARSDLA